MRTGSQNRAEKYTRYDQQWEIFSTQPPDRIRIADVPWFPRDLYGTCPFAGCHEAA
jgi:hypothetical protein